MLVHIMFCVSLAFVLISSLFSYYYDISYEEFCIDLRKKSWDMQFFNYCGSNYGCISPPCTNLQQSGSILCDIAYDYIMSISVSCCKRFWYIPPVSLNLCIILTLNLMVYYQLLGYATCTRACVLFMYELAMQNRFLYIVLTRIGFYRSTMVSRIITNEFMLDYLNFLRENYYSEEEKLLLLRMNRVTMSVGTNMLINYLRSAHASSNLWIHFKDTIQFYYSQCALRHVTSYETAIEQNEIDEGDECVVCLDAFCGENRAMTSPFACNTKRHFFHSRCFMKMVENSERKLLRCPMCRAEIS